jgi:enoyl-CoA hydratase
VGFEHVDVEKEGAVATLWLDRPEKMNAMSIDIWADIPTAMASIESDEDIRVVILAGRGPCFTVGIDIGVLAQLAPSGPSQAISNRNLYEKIRELQQTASVIADSRLPVIAAVHGYCLGAGMDLITACDIRLCSDDAIFSVRETKMGLVADVGTLQRLPEIIGAGHTAEMALTGADFDASHAVRIGLCNETLPDQDALMKRAGDLAGSIASNSPLVAQGIKRVLAANRARTVDEALDFVAQWNTSYLISNDLMEAISAFGEKREPEFKGE